LLLGSEEQKQKKPASIAVSPNVFRFSPTFLTSRTIFKANRHLQTQVGTTANSGLPKLPFLWFIYISTSNNSFSLVIKIRFHNSATTAGRKTLVASGFEHFSFMIIMTKNI
jgi:hypothetical protein